MKLKMSALTTILLMSLPLSSQAAKELTPELAAQLTPFERVTITGRFNSIEDAVKAASRKADEMGADAFYVQGTSESNKGGNLRVTADLYKGNLTPSSANTQTTYIEYLGVKLLPKQEAVMLQPFDTVSVSGYFSSQDELQKALAKAAKEKDAYAFYVVRQIDVNSKGGNQLVTAYVYKQDAPKRRLQVENAIPADSEAGKAALAAGGEAAKRVEIPGVASDEDTNVGRFYETKGSTQERFTVTLNDGTRIQEINSITAAQMAPFDSISFTGHFSSTVDVANAVAKRAAEKGAKYYHITRQWQNKSGGNLTINADLYK